MYRINTNEIEFEQTFYFLFVCRLDLQQADR